jgi:hypothetical protein
MDRNLRRGRDSHMMQQNAGRLLRIEAMLVKSIVLRRQQWVTNSGMEALITHLSNYRQCNPNECPQNKLYSKVADDARRESGGSACEAPKGSLASPDASKMDLFSDSNEKVTE